MQIEVRIPKQGELWWRRKSEVSYENYDGLYIVSEHYGPQPMYRIYGSVEDLKRSKIAPWQFGITQLSGKSYRLDQLVSGEWFLAAEVDQVAAFLRSQIEAYRQWMIDEASKGVATMLATVAAGKHSENIGPIKWIG